MLVTNNEKDNLMQELEKLGHLPNGRKVRSDKGKPRPNYSARTKMQQYLSVRTKLLKKASATNDDLLISTDINGYFIDIPEKLSPTYGSFQATTKKTKSKTYVRSVKYSRTQKSISLEKYRFEAWQEMALNPATKDMLVPLPNKDLTKWAFDVFDLSPKEALKWLSTKVKATWRGLFCQFYCISNEDVSKWTYELWQEHYQCLPGISIINDLPSSFEFRLDTKPGTPEFYPEYSWYTKEREELHKLDEQEHKKFLSYAHKIKKETN